MPTCFAGAVPGCLRNGLAVKLAFALTSCVLAGRSAEAQTMRVEKTARAGHEILVTFFGEARRDCRPGARPRAALVRRPANGQVRLADGVIRTDRVRACPGLELPIVSAYYRSNPGFEGTDRLSFRVRDPSGRVTLHEATIGVSP